MISDDSNGLSAGSEPDYMEYEEDEIHFNNLFVAATCAIYMYHQKYICKVPSMPLKDTGELWVQNVLNGNPCLCLEAFRMPKEVFLDLLGELGSKYGLRGSRSTSIKEVLAMTLSVLGRNESNRTVCKRFQHSGETVSRYFNEGLSALVRMSMDIISPIDFEPENARDAKCLPYFKDCIGVIDITHVKARVPVNNQIVYTGKKECPKQKVLAICDFNMCFTFVVPGWEGTTKDATILTHVIGDPSYNFPVAFKGKYYLVNSQYPMRQGFLKPYMEYSHEYQKIFNERHSTLHNVVKRAFKIWKEKWTVLQDMPFFSNEKQKLIIAATMALHNYIRRHHSQSDSNSGEFDENVEFFTLEAQGYHVGDESLSQPGRDDDENDDTSMTLRDRIAHELATCAISI